MEAVADTRFVNEVLVCLIFVLHREERDVIGLFKAKVELLFDDVFEATAAAFIRFEAALRVTFVATGFV